MERAATVAELIAAADEAGVFRQHVGTVAELYDLIAPATPDKLWLLDAAGSIFRADWWIGNDACDAGSRHRNDETFATTGHHAAHPYPSVTAQQ